MILATLKKLYGERGDEVENWLAAQRAIAAPFITTSVDLRHSGLRLAPVDTNLFPAGFQNLSPAGRARASRFFARYMQEHFADAKRVLIVPESHTRNLPYLDNLATLSSIIENAGYAVTIGSLVAEAPTPLTSAGGIEITQHPLTRTGDTLSADGFTPDLILMNNDMTAGVPDIMRGISQPIIPSTRMGWYQRHKSEHFAQYQNLSRAFATHFSIDPWLICPESVACGVVDFKDEASLQGLAAAIEKVLEKARAKHIEYGISDEPYVFVKADSGTYGMGIMTVHNAQEVLELNKKARNKMQTVKEGARVSKVIIQEGIKTIDTVGDSPAEPMVYMIDGVPVGGMYRVNDERDALGNLNASGMRFTGMCDETEDECGQWKKLDNCNFRSHGIIAALAALAAAREVYNEAQNDVAA